VDAYLAELELAQRPRKSVNDKRKFLTVFMQIVGKSFVDEYDRNDVLKFRKARLLNYEPKSVHTQMMAVVTFFNKHLKIKLGMKASDCPEYSPNDPEPYSRAEIVAMEAHTQGKANLLVRLFRSTGMPQAGNLAFEPHRHFHSHQGNSHPPEAVLPLPELRLQRKHLEAEIQGWHAQHSD